MKDKIMSLPQSIGQIFNSQPKFIKRLDIKQAAFQCGMKPQDLYNARSQGRDGGFIQWDYADKCLYVLDTDVSALRVLLEGRKASAVKHIRPKSQAAVELGRRGGKKGGIARRDKLSPERRNEIAVNAAKARWASGDSDSPTFEGMLTLDGIAQRLGCKTKSLINWKWYHKDMWPKVATRQYGSFVYYDASIVEKVRKARAETLARAGGQKGNKGNKHDSVTVIGVPAAPRETVSGEEITRHKAAGVVETYRAKTEALNTAVDLCKNGFDEAALFYLKKAAAHA